MTVDHIQEIQPVEAIAPATIHPLTVSRFPGWFWHLWSVVAAFGTYFCMYFFRQPFKAATFEDMLVAGLSLKVVLVISHTLGYMLSKFIGIKIIAEMPPARRAGTILVLVMFSEVMLLLFGLIPSPWNAFFLFLNGLALGMVFGLVLGFLEGRRATEALTAGLCTSFILADAMTKSLGTWLLAQQVSEQWMPFTAGLIFVVPFLLFVAMLAIIPPPTAKDIFARTERVVMSRNDRWQLYSKYMVGLTLLVIFYLLISIVRSIRSDFAAEIWRDLLGVAAVPETFLQSEYWVMLGVIVINGSLVFIRDNRWAFFASLGVSLLGVVIMGYALVCERLHAIDGFWFMVLVGNGLYLPYVAMHTTVFERFLAMTREKGNLGFLMYVADSIGYLGVVGALLAKNSLSVEGSFIDFFVFICWIAAGVSLCCVIGSCFYFSSRSREPKLAVVAEVQG